jgi:hypothetical protein
MLVSTTSEGSAPPDDQAEARRQSLLAATLDQPDEGGERVVASDFNRSYDESAQVSTGFARQTRR